jgi:putative flippase GtrA
MTVRRFPSLLIEVGRIVRFRMVGIAATFVYIAAAMVADEWLRLTRVLSAIIGQAASTAISNFGHLHYSFKVKSEHRVFLWRFVLISIVVLSLNVGVSWLVTNALGASHRLAIFVVAVLIPTTNYLCNRFWIFVPGRRQTPETVQTLIGTQCGTDGGA